MLKLLAFDFGASSGRAMLGRYDGKTMQLDEMHRFVNEPVSIHGSLYWDVLRLFHEMKQGIFKCVKSGDGDLAGIGTDTWGVDFGMLDSSGALLGNPYHYRDARNEGMIEKASAIVPKREIYEQTGIQFMKFNTLNQLLSMVLNNSLVLDKAETMLLMPDLFNYFLTGEKVCEYTIASTTQMYNPRTGDWARPLLQKLGIPEKILLNCIDPGTVMGRLTKGVSDELNVGGIPVIAVAGHDTGSAVVSVPAVTGQYAFLSSGTWSLMGVESAKPIINDTTFNLDYTNEGGINKTTRLLKNIMGLWIYQECKRTWDKLGEAMSFDELEQAAFEASPFASFINPDDDLFYSPGNMPGKIREYCRKTGQAVPESKGSIVRCIMESLALKYRMALAGLDKIVGFHIPVLHIVGGGSRNKILCRFAANAIARPVITGPVEATAAGNIICQLIALGEVADVSQGRQLIKASFPASEYLPEDCELWDEAYHRFQKLFD